jgi:hypothetical protein
MAYNTAARYPNQQHRERDYDAQYPNDRRLLPPAHKPRQPTRYPYATDAHAATLLRDLKPKSLPPDNERAAALLARRSMNT